MDAVSRLVAGRRSKWLMPVAWLAVVAAVIGFGLPQRFEEVQENDEVAFLPEGTESVQALRAVQQLPGADTVPAIVVFREPGGLQPADRQAIQAFAERLRRQTPRAITGAGRPRPSPDGTALIVTAQVRRTGETAVLTNTVAELRSRVDQVAQQTGTQAAVTGPAGFAADAADVFGGVNRTLLLVTGGLVFVLLILIYRSPIFWMIPLVTVGVAEVTSRGLGYLASLLGLDINGQSAGILLVLVFGAGTDYALLLVARFREELRRNDDKHAASQIALRRAGPAIIASAATVACALLVLLLARVSGTASLGPLGAIGVGLALVTTLTLLPALLAIAGRRAFWPFVPHPGDEGADETRGIWRRIAEKVTGRPRRVWVPTATILAVLAVGVTTLDVGLSQADTFRSEVESVRGQELLAEAFPPGTLAPATVVVPPDVSVDRARQVIRETRGISSIAGAQSGPPGTVLQVVLAAPPFSDRAFETIERLRSRLGEAGIGEVLVGGPTAQQRDYRAAARRDNVVVPPIVLVVVFAILALLLRALLLPLLLVASVVLSFAASLGVSALVFDLVFGFPGVEATILLVGFIFLVALGVDYNIFLTTRVREETHEHGTREGVRRGLAVTGAVITAAGIVLAGTFSTLGVLPLVVLTEIGFLVAFGILLDTFIVRSVLIPALMDDIGPKVWWPSRLARTDGEDGDDGERGGRFERADGPQAEGRTSAVGERPRGG